MLQLKRAMAATKRFLFSDSPGIETFENSESAVTPSYESQRRSTRHELELLLSATTMDGMVYRGYCRDLSTGGTAALIQAELQVGDNVLLEYQLPHGKNAVRAQAVVRHRNCFRYGLEFSAQSRDFHRLFALFPDALTRLQAECALRNQSVFSNN